MVLALQQVVESTTGTSEAWRLLDLPPAWVIVLLILPLFGFVTWIGYRRETISTPMRVVLSSLRIAAFLLLGLVLARPVVVEQREEVRPAEVLVLLDDSASMSRTDGYAGDEEVRQAIAAVVGGDPATMPRLELTRRALERDVLPALDEGGYDTRLFAFAESPVPIAHPEDTAGRGASTHLGDAITRVLANHRGRPVTDLVVLSDGRSNGGLAVAEAARTAGASGIPVHTVVVGDVRPERNAILELVEAPTDALADDELAVTLRVLGRGTDDVAEVDLVLEELDPRDGAVLRTVATETKPLTAEGERVVLVAPRGQADLRTGERRFRVSIPPLTGETMVDDNRIEFAVRVAPVYIRVLYVEGFPRYEYRFIKEIFRRSDLGQRNADIVIQCWLASADKDFPQDSSPELPPLTQVPLTTEELLDSFDVVILGDVHPKDISHRNDPEDGTAFFSALRGFVEAGGGLLFQAGEFNNPRAYRHTVLEDLLPVELDASGTLSYRGDRTAMFRPVVEDPAQPHEILRLHPDPIRNRRLWEDPDGLSGFYWYSPAGRAKPGTEVLLRHPFDRHSSDGEPYPILVLGHYPAGRTMFLAVDSTWRWRRRFENRYLAPFWRQAVRWLALGRLKSADRRFRLETTRSSYDLEERVVLEARVLDEDWRPSEKPAVTVRWSGPDRPGEDLELAIVEGRPGTYRGGLLPERPGLYRAWVEVDGQRKSTTEFEVRLPSRELADPSPDTVGMALLAGKTGGRALTLAQIGELSDEFPGDEEQREPISSRFEDAWDRWATLLLALGLLSAEWILRKKVELP